MTDARSPFTGSAHKERHCKMKLYDLHVHTGLSSCADPGANITDYCAAAAENGLEIIGFADHAWDKAIAGASPWYAPQDYERLSARKAEAEAESFDCRWSAASCGPATTVC